MLRVLNCANKNVSLNKSHILPVRNIFATSFLFNEHHHDGKNNDDDDHNNNNNHRNFNGDENRYNETTILKRPNKIVILDAQTSGVIKTLPRYMSKYDPLRAIKQQKHKRTQLRHLPAPGDLLAKKSKRGEANVPKKGNRSSKKETNNTESTISGDNDALLASANGEAIKGISGDINFYEQLLDEDRQQLLVFEQNASNEQLFDSINELKPLESNVLLKSYQMLFKNLYSGYSLKNLLAYASSYYKGPKRLPRSKSKTYYAKLILNDMWGLKADDEEGTPDLVNKIKSLKQLTDEMITTKRFGASKKIMFFLFSDNGKMLFNYTSNMVKILFSRDNNLIVTATESRIRWFEATLNSFLQSLKKQFIDFEAINNLFVTTNVAPNKDSAKESVENSTNSVKERDILPISHIQKVSDVYFDKINANTYILNAVSYSGLSRAKRLLLWYLNYNSHLNNFYSNYKKFLQKSEDQVKFYRYVDSKSLPWIYRIKEWYRLRAPVVSKKINELKDEETKAESIPDNATFTFTESQIDEMYERLSDFALKNKEVKGTASQRWNPPTLSATFGQILFDADMKYHAIEMLKDNNEKDASDVVSQLDNMDVNDAQQGCIFHSHIPGLKKNIIQLPLFNNEDSYDASTDFEFQDSDNHNYYTQIRLVPSPYVSDSKRSVVTNVDNYKNYPPIEIWLELNANDEVQWDTLKVLSVERESNVFVNLPNKASDLKLSNTVTSTLVDAFSEESESAEIEEDNENKGAENILQDQRKTFGWLNRGDQENFNETVPLYLKDQVGLHEFLKTSNLSFNGKSLVKVSNLAKVRFTDASGEDHDIEYVYMNINYRKQLDLKFNNDYLVQFALVEGGSLGGRKIEVSMINIKKSALEKEESECSHEENNSTLTKEEFKRFFEQALALIKNT